MSQYEKKKKNSLFLFHRTCSGQKNLLTNSYLCVHTVSEMVSAISPLPIHTECKVKMALVQENFVWLFTEYQSV